MREWTILSADYDLFAECLICGHFYETGGKGARGCCNCTNWWAEVTARKCWRTACNRTNTVGRLARAIIGARHFSMARQFARVLTYPRCTVRRRHTSTSFWCAYNSPAFIHQMDGDAFIPKKFVEGILPQRKPGLPPAYSKLQLHFIPPNHLPPGASNCTTWHFFIAYPVV